MCHSFTNNLLETISNSLKLFKLNVNIFYSQQLSTRFDLVFKFDLFLNVNQKQEIESFLLGY